MIYLLLSIACATSIVVCFRIFDKWKIKPAHAIVYNYFVCVLTGLFFIDDRSVFKEIPHWNGFPYAIALGFVFYTVFIMVGKNTLASGIVSTSIAMKLSFVIPVCVAIILYGDSITAYKIIGTTLAIASVFLIAYEKEDTINDLDKQIIDRKLNTNTNPSKIKLLLPFLIFIGCGVCDATFNYIQKTKTPAGWGHIVSVMAFTGASCTAFFFNFFRKDIYQWKNVGAGILMGIPNYFSLYFLLKALDTLPWQSSVIFPINNLGIVCLSAFIGFILFRENFNVRKLLGFILAVASIVIIGFIK